MTRDRLAELFRDVAQSGRRAFNEERLAAERRIGARLEEIVSKCEVKVDLGPYKDKLYKILLRRALNYWNTVRNNPTDVSENLAIFDSDLAKLYVYFRYEHDGNPNMAMYAHVRDPISNVSTNYPLANKGIGLRIIGENGRELRFPLNAHNGLELQYSQLPSDRFTVRLYQGSSNHDRKVLLFTPSS